MGTGAIKSPPEGARQIDVYRRLVSGPLFVETVFSLHSNISFLLIAASVAAVDRRRIGRVRIVRAVVAVLTAVFPVRIIDAVRGILAAIPAVRVTDSSLHRKGWS